jgi:hypothetical protein
MVSITPLRQGGLIFDRRIQRSHIQKGFNQGPCGSCLMKKKKNRFRKSRDRIPFTDIFELQTAFSLFQIIRQIWKEKTSTFSTGTVKTVAIFDQSWAFATFYHIRKSLFCYFNVPFRYRYSATFLNFAIRYPLFAIRYFL